MAVVALVSGGLDSLVMCKLLDRQEEEVVPIFIDYGQLAGNKEWEACKKVFEIAEMPTPNKIDLKGYGTAIRSGITEESKDIYSDAFLPGRNLLFLVVASAYASQRRIKSIAIGLLSPENHMFPDQTDAFIVNANFSINSALGDYYTILTPLIGFGKGEIVTLAEGFGLPIGQTYSCHSGRESYCGECIACKEILGSGKKDKFIQFNPRGD